MSISFKIKTIFLSSFLLLVLQSCSKEEESNYLENSLVNVKLVGTESQLNRFDLDVLEVHLKLLENENDPNAWLKLNTINSGVLNLTSIPRKTGLTLVDFEQVPATSIYAIKLVLGDENMVVKNHVEYSVEMASEYDNASVNVFEKQLNANKLYEFTLELDLDASVNFTSNSEVKLNPKMNTLVRVFNLF